jgi:two-component SAPR family response regulator
MERENQDAVKNVLVTLGKHGIKCFQYYSDALDYYNEFKPDLIISDYHPELTMNNFIHAYTNSHLKDVPIIILSHLDKPIIRKIKTNLNIRKVISTSIDILSFRRAIRIAVYKGNKHRQD